MTKRTSYIIVLLSVIATAAGLLYIAGLSYPFDTEGEGFRGND